MVHDEWFNQPETVPEALDAIYTVEQLQEALGIRRRNFPPKVDQKINPFDSPFEDDRKDFGK